MSMLSGVRLPYDAANTDFPVLDTLPQETFFVGAEAWAKRFISLDNVPLLPDKILDIVNQPSLFYPTKKVKQMEKVVLMPKQINGYDLTLNLLDRLIEHPLKKASRGFRKYHQAVRTELGDKGIEHSYWMIITTSNIPYSTNITYDMQQQLITKQGKGIYGLPTALEATTYLMLELSNDTGAWEWESTQPTISTHCSELVRVYPSRTLSIGGSSLFGIDVTCVSPFSPYDYHGIQAVRRFPVRPIPEVQFDPFEDWLAQKFKAVIRRN